MATAVQPGLGLQTQNIRGGLQNSTMVDQSAKQPTTKVGSRTPARRRGRRRRRTAWTRRKQYSQQQSAHPSKEMDKPGNSSVDQLARAKSPAGGPAEVAPPMGRKNGSHDDGQCSRPSVPSESTREDPRSGSPDIQDSQASPQQRHQVTVQTRPRGANSIRGQPESSVRHGRLSPDSAGVQAGDKPTGDPTAGSVCQQIHHQDEGVLLLPPGQQGGSEGRIHDIVGAGSMGPDVRLSPATTNTEGDPKHRGGEVRYHLDTADPLRQPMDAADTGSQALRAPNAGKPRTSSRLRARHTAETGKRMALDGDTTRRNGSAAMELIVKSTKPRSRKRKHNAGATFFNYVNDNNLPLTPETLADYLTMKFNCQEWDTGTCLLKCSDIKSEVWQRHAMEWTDVPILTRTLAGMKRIRPLTPKYSDMWDISLLYNYFNEKVDRPNHFIDARTRASVLTRASTCVRTPEALMISRSSLRLVTIRQNKTDLHRKFTQCSKETLLEAIANPTNMAIEFQLTSWKTKHFDPRPGVLSKPHRIHFFPAENTNVCAAAALIRYYLLNWNYYQRCDHDSLWLRYKQAHALRSVSALENDANKVFTAIGIDMEYGQATIRHAVISNWHKLGVPREVVSRRTLHKSEGIISLFYDRSPTPDLTFKLVQEGRMSLPNTNANGDSRYHGTSVVSNVAFFLRSLF